MDDDETLALTLFGAGSDRKDKTGVIVNQFNGQEYRDPFQKRIEEICLTTVKQRFRWDRQYSDIKQIVSFTRQSKNLVCTCFDTKNKKQVALKVKKVDKLTADGRAKTKEMIDQDFVFNTYEIYFLEKLANRGHVNIVSYNETWALRHLHEIYIEMELCEGTLATLMKKHGFQLPMPIAFKYFKQALRGVKFCHDNGVIHADIKEENFLIKNGVVKLCDFDVSREVNIHDSNGLINTEDNVNDRRYLPLELLLHTPKMGYAVDMYAMGCILIKMFSGGCRVQTDEHGVRTALYESTNWQRQLEIIHCHSGPIDDWYFANGLNKYRLVNPVNYGEKYKLEAMGFDAFFNFLPDNRLLTDLMKRMINSDQVLRISAHAALNHSFFFHYVSTHKGETEIE